MYRQQQTIARFLLPFRFLTVTAIFVALTYIFTAFINVRLPIAANGGLIHLGNVPLFIGAIIFGKKTGAIAGGVGMGLFDLLSGWTLWAPFTFVIVALMGFTVGKLTEDEKHQNFKWYVIALIAACVIKSRRLLYRRSRNLSEIHLHRLLPFLATWYRSVLQQSSHWL